MSESRFAPNLTGFNTIVIREFGRIMRIWGQTILPPAVTAGLYFIIFGSLIGRRIGLMGATSTKENVAKVLRALKTCLC